jgi:hypothetical protein
MDPVVDELRMLQKKIRKVFVKEMGMDQVVFIETCL